MKQSVLILLVVIFVALCHAQVVGSTVDKAKTTVEVATPPPLPPMPSSNLNDLPTFPPTPPSGDVPHAEADRAPSSSPFEGVTVRTFLFPRPSIHPSLFLAEANHMMPPPPSPSHFMPSDPLMFNFPSPFDTPTMGESHEVASALEHVQRSMMMNRHRMSRVFDRLQQSVHKALDESARRGHTDVDNNTPIPITLPLPGIEGQVGTLRLKVHVQDGSGKVTDLTRTFAFNGEDFTKQASTDNNADSSSSVAVAVNTGIVPPHILDGATLPDVSSFSSSSSQTSVENNQDKEFNRDAESIFRELRKDELDTMATNEVVDELADIDFGPSFVDSLASMFDMSNAEDNAAMVAAPESTVASTSSSSSDQSAAVASPIVFKAKEVENLPPVSVNLVDPMNGDGKISMLDYKATVPVVQDPATTVPQSSSSTSSAADNNKKSEKKTKSNKKSFLTKAVASVGNYIKGMFA